MQLAPIDWLVIGGYVLFAIIVGLRLRRRAGADVDEFFLSGRSLPWWLAGTSMVATSFAADTPLVISGWVRDSGIWENWIWWCEAVSGMLATFLFARWWRRAEVMTKAELTELRYSGPDAKLLRGFLAFLHAFFTNTIILCWVLVAAAKILDVLLGVDKLWAVAIASTIALSYATLAGFWGVVITDLLQFVFAMVGSVALAIFCWQGVGGGRGVQEAVEQGRIPAGRLDFFPPPGEGGPWDASFWTLSFTATVVLLGVRWWAAENVDGSPVAIQRICASRDERQGMLSVLWYSVAHYAIRPWPWFMVAIASLIVLPPLEVRAPVDGRVVTAVVAERQIVMEPVAGGARVEVPLQAEGESADWQVDKLAPGIAADRAVQAGELLATSDSEKAYVVMLSRYLPSGLLGIAVASLLAAFMSTIDTHVNLAASYFVNDIYRRFLVPQAASPRHYVVVARLASVGIMVVAGVLAFFSESISDLFKFFLAFLSGVGPVYVLRWIWWRITARVEIAALFTSAVVATTLQYLPTFWDLHWSLGPLSDDGVLQFQGQVLITVGVTLTVTLVSLLLVRAPDPAELTDFYRRVRPLGWWGPVKALAPDVPIDRTLFASLCGAAGGLALIFGALFGTGCLLLGKPGTLPALIASGVGGVVVWLAVARLEAERQS